MMPHPTFFTAAIAASTLALTSCGSADEEPDPSASTPEQSPSTQESEPGATGEDGAGNSKENPEAETPAPESGPEASEDSASSGDDDTAQDEDAEEGDEPQPEPEAFNPEEFSLERVQQEVEPGDIADLGDFTAVRHGVHEGYERLVFEFSAAVLPNSFAVEYSDDPRSMMMEDPIDVPGKAALFFRVNSLHPGHPDDSPAGEDLVEFGPEPYPISQSNVFTEIHSGGRFETVGEYYIGLDAEREIRVEALDDPARIIIDVATP